jgi:hypothetical protein
MADVYLSYQRNDAEIASQIADALEQAGMSVWFDRKDLQGGETWAAAIANAIEAATLCLVLVSDAKQKSTTLAGEASYAEQLRKKILPVKARPDFLSYDAMELYHPLLTLQWFDLEEGLPALIRTVESLIGRQPQERTSDPASTTRALNKGYAFISYCHEDHAFRDELVRFLGGKGYLYWEYGEGERELEKLMAMEIESKILESSIVLSVVSDRWKASMWCVKEFFFAKEVKRPVFVLKAGSMSPSLALAGETFIDFTQDQQRGFEMLGRELARRGL